MGGKFMVLKLLDGKEINVEENKTGFVLTNPETIQMALKLEALLQKNS